MDSSWNEKDIAIQILQSAANWYVVQTCPDGNSNQVNMQWHIINYQHSQQFRYTLWKTNIIIFLLENIWWVLTKGLCTYVSLSTCTIWLLSIPALSVFIYQCNPNLLIWIQIHNIAIGKIYFFDALWACWREIQFIFCSRSNKDQSLPHFSRFLIKWELQAWC